MVVSKPSVAAVPGAPRNPALVAGPAPDYSSIQRDLHAAVQSGPGKSAWLSEQELAGLMARAESAGASSQLKADLATALKTGTLAGRALQLGDAALRTLSAFTGVPSAAFAKATQARDQTAHRELGAGLALHKTGMSDAAALAARQKTEGLAHAARSGQAVAKSEFTPAYAAAQHVGNHLKQLAAAHVEENHPAAKAALDAMAPQVTQMVRATAAEVAKDPEAVKRVGQVVRKLGKEGFAEAAGKLAPDIGEAFTRATGAKAMEPAVVSSMLSSTAAAAKKLAPAHADTVAKACANVGAKLGLEVGQQATQAVVATVAKKAATEGAEAVAKTGAKKAATEGAGAVAKVGVKAAASTGKAVPALGNAIAVGSTCLAGAALVKQLAASPKDVEGICKEGVNTLLQGVGIAFPWVALAGDVVDVGWTAKKAVTDAHPGQGKAPALSKKDLAPLVAEPAKVVSSALQGAGHAGPAQAFSDLANTVQKAADGAPLKPGQMEKSQLQAMAQLASTASSSLTTTAQQEKDPGRQSALSSLAHGFGELFSVIYQHNKLKGETGPKRADLMAQLMRISSDCASAGVALGLQQLSPG